MSEDALSAKVSVKQLIAGIAVSFVTCFSALWIVIDVSIREPLQETAKELQEIKVSLYDLKSSRSVDDLRITSLSENVNELKRKLFYVEEHLNEIYYKNNGTRGKRKTFRDDKEE